MKKSLLILGLAVAGTLATFAGSPRQAQAHHEYAPVRPGSYQPSGLRDSYNWWSNPNRPRRISGQGGYPGSPSIGASDIYETFVVPDQNPMSWEEASQLCDRDGGKLAWRRDRKVCLRKQ